MKIVFPIAIVLLLGIMLYWFNQEEKRIKINTENETVTGIEKNYTNSPTDSTAKSNTKLYGAN